MVKPVTGKIGEQIKKEKKKKQTKKQKKTTKKKKKQTKKTGRTDREDDRANAGASIAWTTNICTAPKKKPTGYIADPDKGIDYHWIPDKYKKVSELVEIKKRCG